MQGIQRLAPLSFLVILLSPGLALGAEDLTPLCNLKWIADGYGNVPDGAVPASSTEYVGRVFIGSEWVGGRVSRTKGKAYVAHGGEQKVFDTYEVLVNPAKCVLSWIGAQGGNRPSGPSVPVDLESYVGRATLNGITYGGYVSLQAHALLFAVDGKEESSWTYEVLTSSHQALNCTINYLEFPDLDLGNLETLFTQELIGQDEVHNADKQSWQQTISHKKLIRESFVLEESLRWAGMATLSINSPLWFGSSDLDTTWASIPDSAVLKTFRSREFALNSLAQIPQSTKFSKFCTFVTMLEGVPLPFEAEAVFSREGFTGKEVAEILKATGRTVIGLLSDDSVAARVEGTLNGRFGIRTSSVVSVLEGDDLCTELTQKSMRRQKRSPTIAVY